MFFLIQGHKNLHFGKIDKPLAIFHEIKLNFNLYSRKNDFSHFGEGKKKSCSCNFIYKNKPENWETVMASALAKFNNINLTKRG